MDKEIIQRARTSMQKAVDFLGEELKNIRTARANPALVSDIEVEVYGQPMAVKQIASVSTPDAKSITVSPWDSQNLAAIEKAIRTSDLGFSPTNDGKALHIAVPPLTQETREQLVKQVGEKLENCLISTRNARHEALNEAKRLQKDGSLSEDDYHRLDKQLNTHMDELRSRTESIAEAKRQELRQV